MPPVVVVVVVACKGETKESGGYWIGTLAQPPAVVCKMGAQSERVHVA